MLCLKSSASNAMDDQNEILKCSLVSLVESTRSARRLWLTRRGFGRPYASLNPRPLHCDPQVVAVGRLRLGDPWKKAGFRVLGLTSNLTMG